MREEGINVSRSSVRSGNEVTGLKCGEMKVKGDGRCGIG